MNKDFSNCSASVMDSIRKVSRGGGVRTRGGRLPPVKLQHVLTTKKIVAPKIPQKRNRVKKEDADQSGSAYIKQENEFQTYQDRGRGRGRKLKNYIQTDGIFAEGPAVHIKKEREYASYGRSSGPRLPKGASYEDSKLSLKAIKSLLESESDTEEKAGSDSDSELKPIKFPYVKEIKQIKKEIDPEDIKPFIKVEPPDDDSPNAPSTSNVEETIPEKKLFTQIKTESFFESEGLLDDMKKMERDGLMMLLQFPSYLPINTTEEPDEIDKKNKKQLPVTSTSKEKDEENKSLDLSGKVSIHDLPEGYMGKFQVLKSGRMRLIMGSIIINLEPTSSPDFAAEVVSIPVVDEKNDLIVLGNINRKMILEPHVTTIPN